MAAMETVSADVVSQTRPGVTKLLLLLTSRHAEDVRDVQKQVNNKARVSSVFRVVCACNGL